jgi:hypothetical protein
MNANDSNNIHISRVDSNNEAPAMARSPVTAETLATAGYACKGREAFNCKGTSNSRRDANVSKKIDFKRVSSNKDANSTETLQAGMETTKGTPANEGMPTASKTPATVFFKVEMSRNTSIIKEQQDISKQQGPL